MDFKELTRSFNNLPFVGYYVSRDGEYRSMDEVNLISHITDNLYVGGCVQDVDLKDFFSHVFSLYKWERYKFGANTVHTEITMYDSHSAPVDTDAVEKMSDEAVEALSTGDNVLIHCQAGINRSNLVAARTLMKWKNITAAEAIDILRAGRSELVLSNRKFYDWLVALDG